MLVDGASAGDVLVRVAVTEVWSVSLSIWKRLVKPVGVSCVPPFVMRDESVVTAPLVAVVGVMAPAVRFGIPAPVTATILVSDAVPPAPVHDTE